jgi:outer membrane scaffolding protein for murein synthesis (MipA/OmpV family)
MPQSPLRRHAAFAVLTLMAAAFALPARADRPLWELGAGLGSLSVPHYRGSDQNHRIVLPIPYFVYRGDVLRSDREGTRAVLLDTEKVDFDLSVDGSPPTRSADDNARAGLPALAATLEFGPNLNLRLLKTADMKVELRLPVRAATTLESHPRSVGWTLNPVLNLDLQWQGWNLGLQGGPLAASRAYHAYFYGVDPAFATADRPAYVARGGAAGWGLAGSATRRLGDWWLAGFVRTDSLSGAVFRDSPLVRQSHNVTAGLALSYVFKVSERRVAE